MESKHGPGVACANVAAALVAVRREFLRLRYTQWIAKQHLTGRAKWSNMKLSVAVAFESLMLNERGAGVLFPWTNEQPGCGAEWGKAGGWSKTRAFHTCTLPARLLRHRHAAILDDTSAHTNPSTFVRFIKMKKIADNAGCGVARIPGGGELR